ncbi:MAG: hypothetical protein JWO03_3591 [Bacteroidetes bacterium]|nr:hypothetical protein [Bacteroidota bacterium]
MLTEGYSQVGINILNPDSSAILQLESNKRGLGLSRLTTPQMNAINAPLNGLTIYNTTDSVVEYWNGECWLKAWEPNCYYCDFQMSINHPADTLDRVNMDSVFATITVNHIHGSGSINATWSALPPPGVLITGQGSTTIGTSGTFNIVVKADVFAGSGMVPILITAYCGNQAHFLTYNVYIKPCVEVDVTSDDYNYDVQGRNSTLLPAGVKECVVVNVFSGVTVHSNDPALPSLTVGNLNPLSIVGFLNNGSLLARGGDGGGFLLSTVGGNPGGDGGNALNLTTRTILRNTGQIYAGGGGGGSIGLSYTSPSIPIIGHITLGFGVGGGGGSENGQGGTVPSGGITLGYYRAGTAATSGVNSVPGTGGQIVVPIPITISVATITITPNVIGGNGGGYAQPGTASSLNIHLSVCVSIPIIGTICPINTNLPVPLGGGPGNPGLAVKRNGNPLQGLPDGPYNSFLVKGTVAP